MPPDLSAVARPLAVPSPQNCEGAVSGAILAPRPIANGVDVHQPSCQSMASGAGGKGTVQARLSSQAVEAARTPATSRYHITPALRNTFAAVGACDKSYSFKEVLGFLKSYLYSKRHMFDANDILYVNCKGDRLGDVLQVDRFHYNDVRSLIAKHVIPEHPINQSSISPDKCERTSSSVSLSESSVNSNPATTNGKTFSGTGLLTNNQNSIHPSPVENQNSVLHSSVPGSSRQTTENVGVPSARRSRHSSGLTKVTFKIPFEEVPDSNSDSESVYSYQGYETAYCHNTEFEETDDASEDIEFEEFEVPSSEDDEGRDMDHSDDSDTIIEDVEVALLAVQAVYDDELEEDFWADDSDIESTDEDPELAHEKWGCLSCGIKNKPFVRYCEKCWQLRKNWLPERPRKKRRKPRPKKKQRRRSNSIQSEEGSATDHKGSEPSYHSEKSGGLSTSSSSSGVTSTVTDSGVEAFDLPRTVSTASTISLGITSPPHFSYEQFSSQDSGICLSQEYTENSQDVGMSDIEIKPSCSKDSVVHGLRDQEVKRNLVENVATIAVDSKGKSRKRKSSSKEDIGLDLKRTKINDAGDITFEEPAANADHSNILATIKSEFEEYIKSRDWTQYTDKRDLKRELKDFFRDTSESESDSELSQLCSICFSRPKNATITHGRISHQATCYQCARRLLDTGSRCPVCRRKIHMVSKNIVV